jgi:hypothetical protein
MQALFQQPFLTRWLLDVELLARMRQGCQGPGLPPVAETIYEYPLDVWQEVPGSKVTTWDFAHGLGGHARIGWRYRQ